MGKCLSLIFVLIAFQSARSDLLVPTFLVPTIEHPTLQSAVDAIPGKGKILFSSPYSTELTVIKDKEVEIIGTHSSGASIIKTNRTLGEVAFTLVGKAKVTLNNLNLMNGLYSIEGIREDGAAPSLRLERVFVNLNLNSGLTGPTKVVTGEFHEVFIRELDQSKGEGSGIDIADFKYFELINSTLTSRPGRGLILRSAAAKVVVKISGLRLNDFENGGVLIDGLSGDIDIRNLNTYNTGRAAVYVRNSSHVVISEAGLNRGSGTNQFYDGVVLEQSSVLLSNVSVNYPYRYGIFVIGCSALSPRPILDIFSTRVTFLQAGHSWASTRKIPCSGVAWNWFGTGGDESFIFTNGFESDTSGNQCRDSQSDPDATCVPYHAPESAGYF